MAIFTFLGLNDIGFDVPEAEFAIIILALAAGEVSEDSLARWIRDNRPSA
jgi:death-on-curing protein